MSLFDKIVVAICIIVFIGIIVIDVCVAKSALPDWVKFLYFFG